MDNYIQIDKKIGRTQQKLQIKQQQCILTAKNILKLIKIHYMNEKQLKYYTQTHGQK